MFLGFSQVGHPYPAESIRRAIEGQSHPLLGRAFLNPVNLEKGSS